MSWQWLEEAAVLVAHEEQIAAHGGHSGVRDHGLLDSALARPQNLAAYGEPTAFELAAAYTFGIVRNYPFIDGNKRIGFLCAYAFLALNGHRLIAEEAEAAVVVIDLADGSLGEAEHAAWLGLRSEPRR